MAPATFASDQTGAHAGFPPQLVRASAGTGKTYQLTARLMRLLLQKVPAETILATTFTRKAASEITTRILVELAAAADESSDDGLNALREKLDLETLPRTECLKLLESLLRNIHRLRICTLDSLFSQLAKSFSFELELPPAWRLTDEIEEVWLQERAVDAMIANLDRNELSAALSMLSKGEVRRSIGRELMQVVDQAYRQSRGSAADAWDQIRPNKRPIPSEIQQALDAFRSAQPKQKTLMKQLERVVAVIEQSDFASLSDETLIANIATAKRMGSDVRFGRSVFPDGLRQAFETLYACVRSDTLALLDQQNNATASVLQTYHHFITQIKFASRMIGFDDVVFRLAERFANLDHRELPHRMDGAIDHILLDEFQDTSTVQWQVLRPLAQRVTDYAPDPKRSLQEEYAERSFFCVGDTKQAIYGWRGGVAEIFDTVSDELPGVMEEALDISRRSSPVVIDFVNQVFGRLARHPVLGDISKPDSASKDFHAATALHRFARNFPQHETAKQELAGYVRMETVDANDQDCELANARQAAHIASQIHLAAPTKQIGILTRSNDEVKNVIDCLRHLGVECSQEGGNPLTDSAAVQLVLSALMMSEHPGDKRWEFHATHSPLANIPEFSSDSVRRCLTDLGLAETIEQLADALASHCDDRDTLRLRQLVQLAISYQATAPRVRDFVAMVQNKRVERPQRSNVRVMTVHQSKGLEFDAVILPQLEGDLMRISDDCIAKTERAGDLPTALTRYISHKSWHFLSASWQRAFGDHVQQAVTETICLLYVAITRARQAVYLIVRSPSKESYQNRNAAAIVYHALQLETDPRESYATLFESGDDQWMRT